MIDTSRIYLNIGNKMYVSKEEVLEVKEKMWKSPSGVLWYIEKYGATTFSIDSETGIVYPDFYYSYGLVKNIPAPSYTMDDYNYLRSLFKNEPPVEYDEQTKNIIKSKNFIDKLLPCYNHMNFTNKTNEMIESEDQTAYNKWQESSKQLGELIDSMQKENKKSILINMDTMKVIESP